jgi:hypothetical protein
MLPIPAFSLNASSQEQSSSQEQYRYLLAGWPPLTVLRAMCEALHEGLAAHRKYEALRSKGIPHDGALRQALAIGPPLSWVTRDKRSVSDKKHVRCARPAYVGH